MVVTVRDIVTGHRGDGGASVEAPFIPRATGTDGERLGLELWAWVPPGGWRAPLVRGWGLGMGGAIQTKFPEEALGARVRRRIPTGRTRVAGLPDPDGTQAIPGDLPNDIVARRPAEAGPRFSAKGVATRVIAGAAAVRVAGRPRQVLAIARVVIPLAEAGHPR